MVDPSYFRRRAEALRARASLAGSLTRKTWLLSGAVQYEQLASTLDKLDANAELDEDLRRGKYLGEFAAG